MKRKKSIKAGFWHSIKYIWLALGLLLLFLMALAYLGIFLNPEKAIPLIILFTSGAYALMIYLIVTIILIAIAETIKFLKKEK